MTVGGIVSEPLTAHGIGTPAERRERVTELLDVVGLNPNFLNRYPHEFSGGQRQRIGIARALAVGRGSSCATSRSAPSTSRSRLGILNLLASIEGGLRLTYLFIAHDLSVVRYVSDRIAVMYLGRIVELTSSADLYAHPLHPYSVALLSAVPIPNPEVESRRRRIILKGDVQPGRPAIRLSLPHAAGCASGWAIRSAAQRRIRCSGPWRAATRWLATSASRSTARSISARRSACRRRGRSADRLSRRPIRHSALRPGARRGRHLGPSSIIPDLRGGFRYDSPIRTRSRLGRRPSPRAAPGTRATGYVELDTGGSTVAIPVVLVNGTRPGPRIAATAGLHGCEYVSIAALRQVANGLDPADVSGCLVAVLVANPAAFSARRSTSIRSTVAISTGLSPATPRGRPRSGSPPGSSARS